MNIRKPERLNTIQRGFLLAALSFGLVQTAGAQDFDSDFGFYKPITQTTRFGISPLFGYRFGGGVENYDTGKTYNFADGPAYGLILDYAPVDYYGRYELLWSHQDSSLDFQGDNGLGKVDVAIDVIQLGGELEFGTDRLRTYVSAHAGATIFSSEGYDDEAKFSLGVGVGEKVFLTKNFYLRADLRGFCTVVKSQGSFIYYNGVTVATFSGSTLWQGQVSAGVGVTF